jgi:hypothetical protein
MHVHINETGKNEIFRTVNKAVMGNACLCGKFGVFFKMIIV